MKAYRDDLKNQCPVLSQQNGTHIPHAPYHVTEWEYIYDENTGGDHAQAQMVIDRKFASRALCMCGQVLTINYKGEISLQEIN